MIVKPARIPSDSTPDGRQTLHLSDAGGLTQFGLHRQTLPPGTVSSLRHWHAAEDEFLFVLEGLATVVDDTGPHELAPGDAACWRFGDPNGHHVINRGSAPLTFLIAGSRVAGDICHYCEDGSRQINLAQTWQVEAADGRILRQGPLPPHLMNLRARWGIPCDAADGKPRIIRAADVRMDHATADQVAQLGAFEARLYSDTGGLSQFGAFVETLQPGARSSHRHWHEQEDEVLVMLSGAATVIEDDGPHPLRPGDCACWPAGVANGHQVVNQSAAPCSYLIIGSRLPSDRVHYSDIDRLYTRENGVVRRTRRDGTPLEQA